MTIHAAFELINTTKIDALNIDVAHYRHKDTGLIHYHLACENDENALLAVEVNAQVDGYQSERLKGLEWAATSAVVSLRDLQEGAAFSHFTVHDRVGTGRQADSLQKSMEGVGDKAANEITIRLTEYLKTK